METAMRKAKNTTNGDGIGNILLPGMDDGYFNQPVMFRDCDDHYELIYTGEFEDVGKDSIAVTKLIQDLKDGDKDMELHILINSIGGSVDNLSFVLQQVLEYRHRVTICCGSALSAGFILWACGHERYVSPYSELMYHTIDSGYEGKGTELTSYGNHVERLTMELMEAVNMKDIISKDDMERGKSTEVWYLGKDFIESGKAKDYSEYASRRIPTVALITIAANRFFAKSGDNYLELVLNEEKEYSYGDILEMDRESEQEYAVVGVVDPVDESSSCCEDDSSSDDSKTLKKRKKKKKLSV